MEHCCGGGADFILLCPKILTYIHFRYVVVLHLYLFFCLMKLADSRSCQQALRTSLRLCPRTSPLCRSLGSILEQTCQRIQCKYNFFEWGLNANWYDQLFKVHKNTLPLYLHVLISSFVFSFISLNETNPGGLSTLCPNIQ